MIEIFTWTAMVTIVAGTMPDWQAFEPLTLPRWDLLDWKAQDDALRLLEEHDIDFTNHSMAVYAMEYHAESQSATASDQSIGTTTSRASAITSVRRTSITQNVY
jgi:hypothetical protein